MPQLRQKSRRLKICSPRSEIRWITPLPKRRPWSMIASSSSAAGFGFADDDVDIMLFETFQAVGQLGRPQIHQFTVDARAAITQAARAGDHFFVKALAAAHDGAQHHDFFAAIGAADAVENLAPRERMNLPAALHAMLFADL